MELLQLFPVFYFVCQSLAATLQAGENYCLVHFEFWGLSDVAYSCVLLLVICHTVACGIIKGSIEKEKKNSQQNNSSIFAALRV